MSENLSVLIVGCGNIAGGYDEGRDGPEVFTHAGAYARDPRFTVTACVEPDEARRATFMRRWDIPIGFSNLAACRDSGLSFDLASLCASTQVHGRLLDELLAIPLRMVFSEKPLTGDAKNSNRIIRAYESAGRPLAVNYFRRWMADVQALRTAIEIGEWGGLQSAVGYYGKGLWNCGSHLIDLLQFLLGPLEAEAVFRRQVDYTQEDPTLDALLRTGDGVPVYLIGTDSREFFTFEAELTMTAGRIGIEDLGRIVRSRRAAAGSTFAGYRNLDAGEWRETDYGTAMLSAVDNLAGHLIGGESLISTGHTAAATESVCARLMELAGEKFP